MFKNNRDVLCEATVTLTFGYECELILDSK